MTQSRSGPLAGLKVVEFAGIGPAPMAAMLLSDLGADIIVIDRLEPSGLGIARPTRFDVTRRGRRSVALDLKRPEGIACALALVASPPSYAADAVKTLHVAFNAAETGFDPQAINDNYSYMVCDAIFDSLYTYDYFARPPRLVPS